MVGHADDGVGEESDAETGAAGAVGGGELVQLQADIWGKAALGAELHSPLVGDGLRAEQQERGFREGGEGDGGRGRVQVSAAADLLSGQGRWQQILFDSHGGKKLWIAGNCQKKVVLEEADCLKGVALLVHRIHENVKCLIREALL